MARGNPLAHRLAAGHAAEEMIRGLIALLCATVAGCVFPGESCSTNYGDVCDEVHSVWCGAANNRCTIDNGAQVGLATDDISLRDGAVVHIEMTLVPDRTELSVSGWRDADGRLIDPLRILVTVDGLPLERTRPDRFRLSVSEMRRARIDVSLAPDTSAEWVSVNVGLIRKRESCRVCDL